ncbi:hypothetical protein DVH24_018208 [Malus domestica]|uniref:Uncharacterized protein n=1 Tax=Malus domestica TaxID=3750 RepID=A0A498KFN3_MALDO|nr:hypothetical protein DVH24_018208 [Malus domestica]
MPSFSAARFQIPAVDFGVSPFRFLDIMHEAPLFGHRKSRNLFGSVFYLIILAGYSAVAVAAPWIFQAIDDLIPQLLCSCNVLLLVVTGIFQQYLVSQVQKIRLQGYYSFSQKLKHIVRVPFAVTSYGTAALLLVMVWRPNISFLTLPAILRTIMVIEAICAGSFMSLYIAYVHHYNSLNSQPDVLKSLYSPLQPSSSLEGLRYHDAGRLSDQQMALLQYQRENLHFLSEEILQLQECLSKYERTNDGSTPQVDLAHLLAARDQELRTLSAESELRLARSLIAERDSEIQQVRTTNNQYVEENERLRAILGEWSTRAAKVLSSYLGQSSWGIIFFPMRIFCDKCCNFLKLKLERALEAERISNLELQKKIPTLRSQSQSSAEPSK